MSENIHSSESVFSFFDGLTSRIVTDSGIPSDRFHLGKVILQSLKDAPNFTCQIDCATGECESNGSVLRRSVQCATSMSAAGIRKGDVMVLMAPNHINLAIPFYAAMYLGVIIAPVDRTSSLDDLQETFNLRKPAIIFCQNEKLTDIQKALNNLCLKSIIITFDKVDGQKNLEKFLDESMDVDVEQFRPTDFDPDETLLSLLATSGTTGTPKAASGTHAGYAIKFPYVWNNHTKFPTPVSSIFSIAPLQWLTTFSNFASSPILRFTRLQTSRTLTIDHAYHIINTYKPSGIITSPTFLNILLRSEVRSNCDFSCFELIFTGGSPVAQTLINEVEKVMPRALVLNVFAATEVGVICMGEASKNSLGPVLPVFQYRLVDIDTGKDINEPNVPGELLLYNPRAFKSYYNNPVETQAAFTEDGWYKTGDMFYRDENDCMHFVERIKLLLKHYTDKVMCNISPVEIESVISRHPGVADVAVTGIPDSFVGDLPVACVVRKAGHQVTAEQIKDLVKDSLPDPKHLRGGVVFLDKLPLTTTTKLDRRKLSRIVLETERF